MIYCMQLNRGQIIIVAVKVTFFLGIWNNLESTIFKRNLTFSRNESLLYLLQYIDQSEVSLTSMSCTFLSEDDEKIDASRQGPKVRII